MYAPELLAEQNLDISLIVNHENKQAHARPPDLVAESWLTRSLPRRPLARRLRRAALMNPVTAQSAIKIPNLETRAVCRASHHMRPRRDEAPWLGFEVTLDRQR